MHGHTFDRGARDLDTTGTEPHPRSPKYSERLYDPHSAGAYIARQAGLSAPLSAEVLSFLAASGAVPSAKRSSSLFRAADLDAYIARLDRWRRGK